VVLQPPGSVWKNLHMEILPYLQTFSEQLFAIMFPMMLSGACAAGVLGCYCGVSVVVTSAGDTADSICPGSELLCGDWTLETANRLPEPYCRQQHLHCQLVRTVRTDLYTCMPGVSYRHCLCVFMCASGCLTEKAKKVVPQTMFN